jgi:hypothetical protein
MPKDRWIRRSALALALAVLAGPAAAQFQEPDPDWPCVQRKVPELAMGQMWGGPLPDDEWRRDDAVQALASRLTPRVVPVEQVTAEAEAFVADLSGEARAERLAAVFAAVLQRINRERSDLIAGIARYARRQAELSDAIEQRQQDLARLEAAPDDDRDAERIEALQEALAWETRIYRERAQSLTYVCETPVLLEQRAFAIARALAALT